MAPVMVLDLELEVKTVDWGVVVTDHFQALLQVGGPAHEQG